MDSKTPFIWALIGVISGFIFSLMRIAQYFFFKVMDLGSFNEFFALTGINIETLFLWNLFSSIIGLILSGILAFYVLRLNKKLIKKDCIIIIVLGGLGIFFGMGFGGMLVLIGGILGIVKYNQVGNSS